MVFYGGNPSLYTQAFKVPLKLSILKPLVYWNVQSYDRGRWKKGLYEGMGNS